MKTKLILLLLIITTGLAAEIKQLDFTRADNSIARAYVNIPNSTDSFPLVVYVDGSYMQSVKNNFDVMSFVFEQKNMGVLAIEKRGITQDAIDQKEFIQHDYFTNRLNDYIHVISTLNIPNWDGNLIFIGSSEGGKIVPKLALHFPIQTAGIILVGSGGGLSFGDEIKYQIKASNEAALDALIEAKYLEISKNPFSLEMYYDKTYQWFNSYLHYNVLEDLLKIEAPILMIHGVLDTHIPVESADKVKEAFDKAGKNNLLNYRVEDLQHSISKRIDIFLLIQTWGRDQIHTGCSLMKKASSA